MQDEYPQYEPTRRFDNTNVLYGNHYRFVLHGLPDFTFFVQSFVLPSVTAQVVDRPNPYAKIREVADTLTYGSLSLSFLIDAQFKTYSSLYWWMTGYGFPHSYDEIKEFRETRLAQMGTRYSRPNELEKTTATLSILQPDTEKAIVEITFSDVFPISLGEMTFSTTDGEPPQLTCQAQFTCTEFEVRPL